MSVLRVRQYQAAYLLRHEMPLETVQMIAGLSTLGRQVQAATARPPGRKPDQCGCVPPRLDPLSFQARAPRRLRANNSKSSAATSIPVGCVRVAAGVHCRHLERAPHFAQTSDRHALPRPDFAGFSWARETLEIEIMPPTTDTRTQPLIRRRVKRSIPSRETETPQVRRVRITGERPQRQRWPVMP